MSGDIFSAVAELEQALKNGQVLNNQQTSMPQMQPAGSASSNTKHLLAQQIHNKQQQNQHNSYKPLENNVESMDDVIESLLKTEGKKIS